LTSGKHLILEVKGQVSDQEEAKWAATRKIVSALNAKKNFGIWDFEVVLDMAKVQDAIIQHAKSS
jgi:hypothetical protein